MAVCGLRHGQSAFWGDAIGPNPTDRAKAGSKRSVLVEGSGGLLSVVVAGANVHDTKLPEQTLEHVVVARPAYTGDEAQILTKGMTTPQVTELLRPTGTTLTSAVPVRKSWTIWAKNATRLEDGSWSTPWPGSRSAGQYSSATTRRHLITWVCSN